MSEESKSPVKLAVSRFKNQQTRPILAESMADHGVQDDSARRRPSGNEQGPNEHEPRSSPISRETGRRIEGQSRPYQPWRHPSRRSDGNRTQRIPLNFLNLDDNEGGGTPEPYPDDLRAHESEGATQSSRQWHAYNEQPWRHAMRRMSGPRRASRTSNEYNVPDSYGNLSEVAEGAPVQNNNESQSGAREPTLEELRVLSQKYSKELKQKKKKIKKSRAAANGNALADSDEDHKNLEKSQKFEASSWATQLYTMSYLIFFAIFGTLARLGIEALTFYPGAPVVFSELWANFAGSLFMGYLIEDRMLFRDEWGTPNYDNELRRVREQERNLEAGTSGTPIDLAAAKKAHSAIKKTIPLYIGLATGFCGSFTTFGSFMQDCFLALSNDLPTPLNHPEDYSPIHASTSSTVPRNGGYSFMAVTAVILVTVALCMSALSVGAHLAIFITPYTPTLPFRFTRNILDPAAVVLGWGCWIGAVLMTIFPPDTSYASHETWRGQALFAIVFAPVGCLMRFYISLLLNAKIPSFPLGTFVVNVFGTMILGMSWDLQHVPLGGVIGCQVLQGIESGFCGCITTVSTWVSELNSLKRKHAYRYGIITVFFSLGSLVIIMGSLKWTRGFSEVECSH